MGLTALAVKAFMYGLVGEVQTTGLGPFLDFLDGRRGDRRSRGLITVSNHVSVLDDPLMWCTLPLRTACSTRDMRWGLGAHDICFQNSLFSTFFRLGQVLPTYRLQHSPLGGLFQPTIGQAIHILSREQQQQHHVPQVAAAPASGLDHRSSLGWLHVFPEGRVVQLPASEAVTGYFKWGVSRLVLEADPVPDLIPIFIDGTQHMMPEDRGWPRWVPRIRTSVYVGFGRPLDMEAEFGEHRDRWRRLCEDRLPAELMYGREARELRSEVAAKIRDHVVALGRQCRKGDIIQDTASSRRWTWR